MGLPFIPAAGERERGGRRQRGKPGARQGVASVSRLSIRMGETGLDRLILPVSGGGTCLFWKEDREKIGALCILGEERKAV